MYTKINTKSTDNNTVYIVQTLNEHLIASFNPVFGYQINALKLYDYILSFKWTFAKSSSEWNEI